MASGNPALNAKTFEGIGSHGETMTLSGTVNKTCILLTATVNLLLDFDFIEVGVRQAAPRYMEWYAAFGLMVTLIWLYLELLRLLAKSRK